MRLLFAFTILLALASSPAAFAQTAQSKGNGVVTMGVIMQTQGNVALKSAQKPSVVLKKGVAIRAGALVQSDADSHTIVAFPDGQVGALGPNGVLRLNGYFYDPLNVGGSDVSLNLIEGGLRVVMGEIGQGAPSALKLQVGTATVSLQSSLDNTPADASLVTQEGAVAISVVEGRLDVRMPSGQTQRVNAGQTLFISQSGIASLDDTSKLPDVIGKSSLGQQILAQLAASQSYGTEMKQAQSAMSNVTAALKAGQDPTAALALALGDALAALAIVNYIDLPPSPGEVAQPTPSVPAIGTPPTAGAGGGTPCGASCN